ncbi:MAG: aminotransferase class I/II-fold pyridoxal phosphate-dependent enzyme [Armatimonadetes bacterium]|nr:aminotransferase class I/II-fold pyridoxal phosphate-dependent enzyme [Armatimonadota bacterium]
MTNLASMIDLRSDVKSQPTAAMRKAMAEAAVGDDAAGEDPTVAELERRAAEITGKEAAVFVTSGTQGNLVSLLSLTRPGEEMIADEKAHLMHYEGGGCTRIAGLLPRLLPCRQGCLEPAEVADAISQGSTVRGRTGVVVMEDTHNLAGGVAVSPERLRAVAEVAWDAGVRVHLDGARIFNAAVALERPVPDFARWCDTITFCFSKSLGAPAGSVVCGKTEVIQRARVYRRMLGGAMRQAGHLAAAALIALDTMVDRLADDHRRARQIAETLVNLPGVEIDLTLVQTNMVYFRLCRGDISPEQFCEAMRQRGILVSGTEPRRGHFRLVTYHNINDVAVQKVCKALEETLGGAAC